MIYKYVVSHFCTKGNHAGLKNLGATCYVNTFLQVNFHFKTNLVLLSV